MRAMTLEISGKGVTFSREKKIQMMVRARSSSAASGVVALDDDMKLDRLGVDL